MLIIPLKCDILMALRKRVIITLFLVGRLCSIFHSIPVYVCWLINGIFDVLSVLCLQI